MSNHHMLHIFSHITVQAEPHSWLIPTDVRYLYQNYLLKVYYLTFQIEIPAAVASSSIGHTALIYPWLIPLHCQHILIGNRVHICHCLSECMIIIVRHCIPISCPCDNCSGTTGRGTGKRKHWIN